jgi:negative regulator of sigma E activity
MKAHDMNTESAANDLTQLSSREQLSALMDGALPPDQTRFLLRRLQHDAPLGECWERWRLTGEVMRGLAPAQRLPSDFASRVSAALQGGVAAAPVARNAGSPAWLRWGGCAALAASLAVVALMARQGATLDTPQPTQQVAAMTTQPRAPVPKPIQPPPMIDAGSQLATAATAIAAIARPQRDTQRHAVRVVAHTPQNASRDADATAQVAALGQDVQVPQPDIVTRPWPRSVLPQYASGGLTVGFGEHVRGSAPYNPFQAQADIGNLPPLDRQPQATDDNPQREAPSQP